ncbi:hypothetical protein [Paenibacillus sp. J2TS4]|uniref:hypothetical protein n=1 Tax=Paenibacillus sp. J2TS4 TaxID=2807194 RepID=UPI001AFE694A|nr:hypothetical protein [Paenibacillus sp. J2TS4]GIP35038.1 hypothetical protein J2TS4_42480 [Paenibacillus sp. J2TS4]
MKRYIENDSEFVLALLTQQRVSIWDKEHLIDSGGQVEWVTAKTVKINSRAYPRDFYQFRLDLQIMQGIGEKKGIL